MTESTTSSRANGNKRAVQDVRAAVRAMVLELAPARDDTVGPDAGLVDALGYHSLALLELAFTLEEEFDLAPIEEATARRITTLHAIEDHVIEQLAARDELLDQR
jgi:acyl carrier protein